MHSHLVSLNKSRVLWFFFLTFVIISSSHPHFLKLSGVSSPSCVIVITPTLVKSVHRSRETVSFSFFFFEEGGLGRKKLTSLKHAYAPSMKLQPKPRSFEHKRATKQISPKTLRVSYQTVPNSNKFRVSILVWVEPQSHPDTRSGILQNPMVHIIIYQFYRYGYI